jgi:transketolase
MKAIKPIKKVTDIKKLKLLANTIRQDVIIALVSAGSGHSAGPLGMADVFTALYFNVLRHNPKYPFWEGRDILVLSNGHICPVQYAAMANVGYFPRRELTTLRHLGTRLQGHPHRPTLPGLETSSGPLGSGLSQAAGMAYALSMDGKKNIVYCIVSDGEQNAGHNWEAAMFAGKHKLHNLIAIMDRNNIQIDGHTEDVMPIEPIREKYEAFNWHVIDIDGNNIQAVIDACNEAKAIYEKPTMIVAHTIPGKGVSFMENDPAWHGKPPTPEQARIALRELQTWRKNIMRGED